MVTVPVGVGRTTRATAALLVAPTLLDTTHRYRPAAAVVSVGVVKMGPLAPGMSVPFFCHW